MKSICVFCGSRMGADKVYEKTADRLGQLLVKKNIDLVYGGGNIGLMGILATRVMKDGGRVTGIIPHFLSRREHANLAISRLILVDSMHERKAKMLELSDAYIVMPGGLGTMEEFFEAWTWAQLKLHSMPIGVLNTKGYYMMLLKFLDRSVKNGFVKKRDRDIILTGRKPGKLLKDMQELYIRLNGKAPDKT